MPELPEVEAARKKLSKLAKGKKIKSVVVNEDPIVFSGTTHASFAAALEGKNVLEVGRKGKNFYLNLSPGPLHPLFHFGMSGISHILGIPSPVYRVPRSKSSSSEAEWPPKYLKCMISFCDVDDEEEKVVGEWAFCDPRRLGRIKLVEVEVEEGKGKGKGVEDVPPLSELGRDPLLDMPSAEELREGLRKRNAPIKAVLLDQNGPLCGIGNYMVDEILFQSAIHPSHPASHLASLSSAPSPNPSTSTSTTSSPPTPSPTLLALQNPSPDPLTTLHANILYVTRSCVDVDADAEKFPEGWLFRHRWGKGKKKKKGEEEGFVLPDGSTSPISFLTIGGRTSAIVDKIQILPPGLASAVSKGKKRGRKGKAAEDEEEVVEEQEGEGEKGTPKKRKRSAGKGKGSVKKEESKGEEEKLDAEAMEMDQEEEDEEEREVVTSPHFKRSRKGIKEEQPGDAEEEEKPSGRSSARRTRNKNK